MRKGYADAPWGQVHYGFRGEGEAILLLAPAPRSLMIFDALAQRLASEFQAIAMDQPGFGGSDPMRDDATMEDLAESLTHVLDALELPSAHLFGLHTGAKLAAAFAATHPERTSTLIIAGKTHSILPDMQVRNAAMRRVVNERYYDNGAGPLAGDDPLRAWAGLWREVGNLWWSDGAIRTGNEASFLTGLAAKIADSITGHDAVYPSYAANFAFDLAQTLGGVTAPTWVIEITSEAEQQLYGLQGEALAGHARNGKAMTLPEIDPTGIQLHAGVEPLADAIGRIVRG